MAYLRVIQSRDVKKPSASDIPQDVMQKVQRVIDDVKKNGDTALTQYALQFGDIKPHGTMVFEKKDLEHAKNTLPYPQRVVLENTAQRIAAFAQAQKNALQPLHIHTHGIQAGHHIDPVHSAGCYAPGGRFPLPSSVLMTAVTARTAGVSQVWVASPKPTQVTLASACIAQADALLACGGAQAIAAFAYGTQTIPACDVIVGPGNTYVTAAKKCVAGHVGIDMLAGPSELLILADSTANPEIVAADMLAQAEHDPEALPVLITTDPSLPAKVDAALHAQLQTLPTAEIARQALEKGFCVVAATPEEAVELCNTLAPEHLEVHMQQAQDWVPLLKNYGGLFIGQHACEVLGDYGIGPNHVLPTSGCSRYTGGLSVFTFLRIRTYLQSDTQAHTQVLEESAQLARLEGLEAHARAADIRIKR
jgi:phosphoribosyl-ATP pyrophosphohydrolase/phosphoribosyl-AMP cyclohydrolase/histidinol dehydrogenase